MVEAILIAVTISAQALFGVGSTTTTNSASVTVAQQSNVIAVNDTLEMN